MPPNYGRLVEASMALRSEAPVGWVEFTAALREYAGEVTAQMVHCPPEMLNRAQGMAIQATELASVVNDAPKLYEKILIAKTGKKNG